MTDLRQARAYWRYMKSLGWRGVDGAFVKKLPFLALSLVKIQRPERQPNLAALKKFRPIYISYEPAVNHKPPAGFRPGSPLLPSRTIWLDLRKSQKKLLQEMRPKTRYNIKKLRITDYGLRITQGSQLSDDQLAAFYQIYRENAKKQRFWGASFTQLKSLATCFGKKAYLIIARRMAQAGESRRQGLAGNDVIGGLLILVHDRVAYYSHNAATNEGRRLFVPTILTWEAIKLAKKLGCHTFDFEGIDDPRFPVTRKWTGFSRFKKSFGGKEVNYPQALVKWQVPLYRYNRT